MPSGPSVAMVCDKRTFVAMLNLIGHGELKLHLFMLLFIESLVAS